MVFDTQQMARFIYLKGNVLASFERGLEGTPPDRSEWNGIATLLATISTISPENNAVPGKEIEKTIIENNLYQI